MIDMVFKGVSRVFVVSVVFYVVSRVFKGLLSLLWFLGCSVWFL